MERTPGDVAFLASVKNYVSRSRVDVTLRWPGDGRTRLKRVTKRVIRLVTMVEVAVFVDGIFDDCTGREGPRGQLDVTESAETVSRKPPRRRNVLSEIDSRTGRFAVPASFGE